MRLVLLAVFGAVICAGMILLGIGRAFGDKEKNPLKIFKHYGCTECHSISALGVGVVKLEETDDEDDWDEDEEEEEVEAPDLSNVGTKHDAKWISQYLRKKIAKDGKKHKKRFKGSQEERKILAVWLESLKHEPSDSTETKKPDEGKAGSKKE